MSGHGRIGSGQAGYFNDLWKLGMSNNANSLTQKPIRLNEATVSDESGHHSGKSLVVYPNPARNQANLRLSNLLAQGKIRIDILDVTGKVKKVLQQDYRSSSKSIAINTSSFINGLYFIVATDKNGKQVTGKMIVQH